MEKLTGRGCALLRGKRTVCEIASHTAVLYLYLATQLDHTSQRFQHQTLNTRKPSISVVINIVPITEIP
ncbi:hypothetical protein K663_09735 [Sphingobium sp. MI1205]|nr:hypothetical protein K663_09735 [Sphingobium sp. MI1205]